MSKKLRIHQFLSKTGLFNNKRNIYNAIENGLISVDDRIISNKDYQFKLSSVVKYKNEEIQMLKKNIYIVLNKPEGYICARLTEKDIELRKRSMYDLLNISDNEKNSLSCVSELDENAAGLVILTNDGTLNINIVNHNPEIKETYYVVLKRDIPSDDIKKLELGIFIDIDNDNLKSLYKTKNCNIKKLKKDNEIEISILNCKKHQVRQMIESLDNRIVFLKKIKINNLMLNIPTGKYKEVSKKDIEKKLFL